MSIISIKALFLSFLYVGVSLYTEDEGGIYHEKNNDYHHHDSRDRNIHIFTTTR